MKYEEPMSPDKFQKEKVSVNLSPLEIGQIDYLVDRGLFDNRSDFIRSATRKLIETHASEFDQFTKAGEAFMKTEGLDGASKEVHSWSFALMAVGRKFFQELIFKGEKINFHCVGVLHISKDVTAVEIKKAVASCKVYGKLIASKEVRDALREIEESGNAGERE